MFRANQINLRLFEGTARFATLVFGPLVCRPALTCDFRLEERER